MLSIAYYLLKVIICSAIFYGYYRVALHNKIYHKWNRFYLLASVMISLVFPLIRINIWHAPSDEGQVIKLLNVVTTGDEIVLEASRSSNFHITGGQAMLMIYIAASIVLSGILTLSLLRIRKLMKQSGFTSIRDIRFFDTEAAGTPFSFFRNIFWNKHIDIDSEAGRKIFLHELTHARQKHSADKLFMNIVLIFFWCNPFFWLIRREMNMIHEFIADSNAVGDTDTAAFATMILGAAYPRQTFGLTSSFFSSSIKRRLMMLRKLKNPRVGYISRILALPLLTFVFVAFTVKTKRLISSNGIALKKPFTVIIDAGHGGEDAGALAPNGVKESIITLELAKKIKELNNNNNLNIVLTRSSDISKSLQERVALAKAQKADAYISIHINAAPPQVEKSGFDIYISRPESPFKQSSRVLASMISREIAQTYPVDSLLRQSVEKHIYVLDAPDISYPAILVHCGYLTNNKDLDFISRNSNQDKIARDILTAIEQFAAAKEQAGISSNGNDLNILPVPGNSNAVLTNNDIRKEKIVKANTDSHIKKDTLPPHIKSVDLTTDDKVIIIYKNDKAEKITREEAAKRGIVAPPSGSSNMILRGVAKDSVLYVIDGVVMTTENTKSVDPDDIESITVLKDGDAIEKYGNKGRYGVIEIITKSNKAASSAKGGSNIVFQKVETEASFPGGEDAWVKYISSALKTNIDDLKKEGKSGTCLVQFIVNKDGSIREAEALTMKGTKLAETVINAIKNGPQWNPAMQNGRKVTSYRKQPVTFQVAG
jgi:N-acetylmuramoyl-L-alanine amidase